jgi:twitching motility protein PilT
MIGRDASGVRPTDRGWFQVAEIDALLKLMVDRSCSDLHLKAGSPPAVRRDATLSILSDMPSLSAEDMQRLSREVVGVRHFDAYDAGHDVDVAYSLPGVGRFRINVFHQRETVALAARRVATEFKTFQELGLPPAVQKLADEPRGLVLVTGTAGSGKTTTLGSMVDHINRTRGGNIVTIEDPIEVLHEDGMCIVNQREIGTDVESYADALRHVVRQDPNVILIGEMRDNDTVSAALTAAEIGNLVMSTLHTIDATETINRIIDFFPTHQQQIRLMLGSTLRGIISMRLLPAIGGGLVPAVEVLVMTGTIREFITDPEQTYKIRDAMNEGAYYGMQTFDQSLLRLYQDERITLEDATAMAANAHDFGIKVRQLGPTAPKDDGLGLF